MYQNPKKMSSIAEEKIEALSTLRQDFENASFFKEDF
jgi:hypothetical protein